MKLIQLKRASAISFIACVIVMLLANAAGATATVSATGAQVIPPPPIIIPATPSMSISREYLFSSASEPNAHCKKSTLTQDKFLNMVHAIVRHSNLTDIAFIEKTLQVQFGPADKAFAKIHTSNGKFYYADLSYAPIRVSLEIEPEYIKKYANIENKASIYSILTFENLNRVGGNFHDCGYLTRKQFDQVFGGVFNIRKDYATQNLGEVGKNSTVIKLSYLFKTDNDALVKIRIQQQISDKNIKPKK